MVHLSFVRDLLRFFPVGLVEERRLIIDFIWSLGSLGPVIHTTPNGLKHNNHKSFYFFVWGNLGQRITWFSWSSLNPIVFEKVRFKNVFVHTKTQVGLFKFLHVEERLRKAPFSWWITLDRRPNRRNEAVCVFKYLRRSVDGVWSKPRRQWSPPNKRFNEQNKMGCTNVFSKRL